MCYCYSRCDEINIFLLYVVSSHILDSALRHENDCIHHWLQRTLLRNHLISLNNPINSVALTFTTIFKRILFDLNCLLLPHRRSNLLRDLWNDLKTELICNQRSSSAILTPQTSNGCFSTMATITDFTAIITSQLASYAETNWLQVYYSKLCLDFSFLSLKTSEHHQMDYFSLLSSWNSSHLKSNLAK